MLETHSAAARPLGSVLRFAGSGGARRGAGPGWAEARVLLWAALLSLVLFAGFLALATPVYETNDDQGMAAIASGFYTGQPDAHLVFTNVLIGWILCWFYRAWQGLNWYSFYLVTVHFVAMTAIAYVVLSRRRTWWLVLGLVTFFLVAMTRVLLLLQFTTAAFLAGTAGLLLLVDGLDPDRPVNWPKAVAGVALLTLMGLIRDAVSCLLVAVALPFILERFGWRGRQRLVAAGGICVVLFLGGWQCNRWYYNRDPAWSEFREYNQLRGAIQGTRLARYAARAAPAAGWTANDGGMFVDFFLSDPEVYGSVSQLRAFLAELRGIDRVEGRSTTEFHFFLPRLLGYKVGLMMSLAMVASIWLVMVGGRDRGRYGLAFAAMYVISTVLSYYLLSTSRLPERVACCFPIFTLAQCLYWLTVKAGPSESKRNFHMPLLSRISWPNLWRPVQAVLLGATVFYCAWLLSCEAKVLWTTNRWNRELKSVSRVIFSPLQSLLPNGQRPVLVAMPYDSVLERCLVFHPARTEIPFTLVPYGWLSQSPLYLRLLEDCRLKPFAASLLRRQDVFLLMEKRWIRPLRTFYREHYGTDVEFVVAFDSDATPAYRDFRLQLYQIRAIPSQAAGSAKP